MLMRFLVLVLGYVFYFSSLNSLIFLLLVEFMVLVVIFTIACLGGVWYVLIFILLVAVCLGSYGVSLLVSGVRGKGWVSSMVF